MLTRRPFRDPSIPDMTLFFLEERWGPCSRECSWSHITRVFGGATDKRVAITASCKPSPLPLSAVSLIATAAAMLFWHLCAETLCLCSSGSWQSISVPF